ncbi:MAG: 16S rRNA processing protein RimM [Spirochaetes bacterium GWF1_49_6]|jgi:16S rRNA processing protein RimM|nr:MAG: 16S rRNA processing protein RimM [Spirochaetes bacterium GWF1_49_6]
MNKLLIGKIVKPFGIKGEVFLDFFADDAGILEESEYFCIRDVRNPGGYRKLNILEMKDNAQMLSDSIRVIARIDISPDRNQAELLRGTDIFIDEDKLPELDSDEYYIKDLIGLEVFYQSELFGVIENVIQIGERYVFFIDKTDKRKIAVPMEEKYLEQIDLAAKKVVLRSIEELL